MATGGLAIGPEVRNQLDVLGSITFPGKTFISVRGGCGNSESASWSVEEAVDFLRQGTIMRAEAGFHMNDPHFQAGIDQGGSDACIYVSMNRYPIGLPPARTQVMLSDVWRAGGPIRPEG